jgi:hypothetical protein
MVNKFFSIEPVNSETIKNLKVLNLKTPYKIKINETIKNRKCSSLFISDCKKCNPVLIFENCLFDELTILNKNSQIKSIIFNQDIPTESSVPNIIFYGFKSLCMIPLVWQYSIPFKILVIKCLVTVIVN